MIHTGLIHAIDASTPPASATELPDGTEAVLGYLGSPGSTPHIWTKEEWQPFEHLMQMGIWVADFNINPVKQARQAADAAHSLGWFRKGPAAFRAVLGDFEAVKDPAWIGEWGIQLRNDGYIALGYESDGVLNANPRLDGVVLAQPNQPPRVPRGQLIVGRQYKWNVQAGNTQVDLDVFDSSTRHLFGHGPRG